MSWAAAVLAAFSLSLAALMLAWYAVIVHRERAFLLDVTGIDPRRVT